MEELTERRVHWKRLLITVAIGAVPTVISYILGWWWGGTIFLLLTLFAACFCFPPPVYPTVFTLFVAIAIAVVTGALIEGAMPTEWNISEGTRIALAALGGASLGVLIPAVVWFLVLFVSTTWVLSVSESFDIPWWRAFQSVATRAFGFSQPYIIVENGEIAVEKPKGVLSSLGGPGIIVVRPGNVVVLERGGKVTRILGPGTHTLKKFEYIKKPVEKKGIVDLRPQFGVADGKDVMTRDGIPLKIEVGVGYQVEPKHITDERPSSHFPGGEATTRVLGAPEYPVYEATIRKVIFNTTQGGWKGGIYPNGPVNVLRDIVATYTFDELFTLEESDGPAPDRRVIKRIEEEVGKRFNTAGAGVWFKGIDIRTITPPEEIQAKLRERWLARVEREIKVTTAEAERDAMIRLSDGRAYSVEQLEKARSEARKDMLNNVHKLLQALEETGNEQIVLGFMQVVQHLTQWVGRDESVSLRYIQAMQAVMQSPGPKSFVITPPTPSPGAMPSPPQPTPQTLITTTAKTEKE